MTNPRGRSAFALLAFLLAPLLAARPLTLDDFYRLHGISDPQASPDGRWVVYVVTDNDVARNRTTSSLWLVPSHGGAARPLTRSEHHDRAPRWSPDGRWIAFESDRAAGWQIWLLAMTGSGLRRVTALSTEATRPEWSPQGDRLAFVSAVLPEFSTRPFAEADRLNRQALVSRARSPVKARLLTGLLYRHWDAWVNGRRQHLFVLSLRDGAPAGEPRDVTPGDRDAVPTSATFSAGNDFAFSPDGRELAYTAAPLPTRTDAWSTNLDLWAVNLANGSRRALTDNPAADDFPRYSPDGRWLAYRAQSRPGAEADRWQLLLLDRKTGQRRSLTLRFDASVGRFAWRGDSRSLVCVAASQGRADLWEVALGGGGPQALTPGAAPPGPLPPLAAGASVRPLPLASPRRGSEGEIAVLPGRDVVFTRSTFDEPPEIWRLHWAGPAPSEQALTRQNAALLRPIDRGAVESVAVRGAGGEPIQLWIVGPPATAPGRRHPLVLWVHGGPQSAWSDAWSFQWNAALWAAQGYVLALPNPHGSVGFGQAFTDEVSHDWGGAPFTDLLACLAYLKGRPEVDPARMAAAGGSYGGYMMNWFEGHTTEFRALVEHDGVYDFTSLYGTTDELWFNEHEHGLPWAAADFDRFSPHRFAAHFQTPMLIIQNEQDFRVPLGQGQELFTALQRRGIPSEMLSFPDEGHWVLKPANSRLWHQTIFAWLRRYLGP